MKLLRVCLAAFVLTLLSTPATHAAVTLVLRLEGIPGESTIPGHQTEIDIGEVSFSVEQAVTLKEAGKGGASAGKRRLYPHHHFERGGQGLADALPQQRPRPTDQEREG